MTRTARRRYSRLKEASSRRYRSLPNLVHDHSGCNVAMKTQGKVPQSHLFQPPRYNFDCGPFLRHEEHALAGGCQRGGSLQVSCGTGVPPVKTHGQDGRVTSPADLQVSISVAQTCFVGPRLFSPAMRKGTYKTGPRSRLFGVTITFRGDLIFK